MDFRGAGISERNTVFWVYPEFDAQELVNLTVCMQSQGGLIHQSNNPDRWVTSCAMSTLGPHGQFRNESTRGTPINVKSPTQMMWAAGIKPALEKI